MSTHFEPETMISVPTTSWILKSNLADLFCTAIEAGSEGIGYWCDRVVATPPKPEPVPTWVDTIMAHYPTYWILPEKLGTLSFYIPEDKEIHIVDYDRMMEGLTKLATHRPDIIWRLSNPDDCDLDADDADVAIQFMLFGETIFG